MVSFLIYEKEKEMVLWPGPTVWNQLYPLGKLKKEDRMFWKEHLSDAFWEKVRGQGRSGGSNKKEFISVCFYYYLFI